MIKKKDRNLIYKHLNLFHFKYKKGIDFNISTFLIPKNITKNDIFYLFHQHPIFKKFKIINIYFTKQKSQSFFKHQMISQSNFKKLHLNFKLKT